MPKVKIYPLLPDNVNFYTPVAPPLSYQSGSGNSVILTEEGLNHDKLIIGGKNLKVDFAEIVSGTITSITYANFNMDAYATISGFKLKVGDWLYEDDGTFALTLLRDLALAGNLKVVGSREGERIIGGTGNDVLNGREGDDFLYGFEGRDVLTGGPGSDAFFFVAGHGRDTVADFDARGGPGNQDLIYTSGNFEIESHRNGTIVRWEEGGSLLLEDVRLADVSLADFVMIE